MWRKNNRKATRLAFTLFHKIMKLKDGNIRPGCFCWRLIFFFLIFLNHEIFAGGNQLWKYLWSKCLWILYHRKFAITHYVLHYSIFYDQCALSCQPIVHSFCTQSTFHTDSFSKDKFLEQWPFVFIRQMHLWVDTRLMTTDFTQFPLWHGRCKSNHQWTPFVFTDMESLTDWWVLSNTPIKIGSQWLHVATWVGGK